MTPAEQTSMPVPASRPSDRTIEKQLGVSLDEHASLGVVVGWFVHEVLRDQPDAWPQVIKDDLAAILKREWPWKESRS